MLFQSAGQGWVFLWMAAAGALIGAWYGLLAALRRLLSAGVWLSLVSDIAFGVGAAAMGFALFAAGALLPARRVASRLWAAARHIFVTIRAFRWIKVIFR